MTSRNRPASRSRSAAASLTARPARPAECGLTNGKCPPTHIAIPVRIARYGIKPATSGSARQPDAPYPGLTRSKTGFLVPAVGLPESPGVTWGSVDRLDVAETPLDLSRRVGRPVGAGAGHLRAWQRLRDAVGTAGVLGVVDPVAFPGPDVVQAAELVVAESERGQHLVSDRLGRAWVRRSGGDGWRGATARSAAGRRSDRRGRRNLGHLRVADDLEGLGRRRHQDDVLALLYELGGLVGRHKPADRHGEPIRLAGELADHELGAYSDGDSGDNSCDQEGPDTPVRPAPARQPSSML